MAMPKSDESAVRQVLRALKAGNFKIDFIENGEEEVYVHSEKEAMEAIFAVDECYVFLSKESWLPLSALKPTQWVRFVLGNDPDEVVCDYTVGLEHIIDPLFKKWNQE